MKKRTNTKRCCIYSQNNVEHTILTNTWMRYSLSIKSIVTLSSLISILLFCRVTCHVALVSLLKYKYRSNASICLLHICSKIHQQFNYSIVGSSNKTLSKLFKVISWNAIETCLKFKEVILHLNFQQFCCKKFWNFVRKNLVHKYLLASKVAWQKSHLE